MKHLIDFIDNWQSRRAMVVGDFMLDHYVYGNAERLSPDAPVPVLAVEKEKYHPGGAANVAQLMRALRCEVVCVGLLGADAPGRQLRDAIDQLGCDTSGLLTCDGRPTTVKQSFIGLAQQRHPQKMFRADYERSDPPPEPVARQLVQAAERLLDGVDIVCVEDYDKGVLSPFVCQELIRTARDRQIPVLVDPAAIDDYQRYRGATCITPNRTETRTATGLDPMGSEDVAYALQQTASGLLDNLELTEAVVITLDKDGAFLLQRQPNSEERSAQWLSTEGRSVYDVTGAGDMVLAMLAAARANGADWPTAVQMANTAAGLEVERFGVEPIPIEDIHLNLLEAQRTTAGKLRTLDQLLPELTAYRKAGRKVAFTNGCFDILHAGHVALLRGARAEADMLVLAVNSDASIRKLKGDDRPIVGQDERIQVLSELECIDYLIIFGDGAGGEADTPIPLLKAIKPDVLVKGGDYNHDGVVGWEVVESYGGRVQTISPVDGLSTSNIVERIRNQSR